MSKFLLSMPTSDFAPAGASQSIRESDDAAGLGSARDVHERDIAIALVLELAHSAPQRFSLLGFYDDDQRFLSDLASRLGVKEDGAFRDKLTRVVRKLVQHGVLYARMRKTHKEYLDEPAKQMNYGFRDPGKASLLTRGESQYTSSSSWEAEFLLRRVYPEPNSEEKA